MNVFKDLDSFLPELEMVGIFDHVKSDQHLLLVGFRVSQINGIWDLAVFRVDNHRLDNGGQSSSEGLAKSLEFSFSSVSLAEFEGFSRNLAVQVFELFVSADDFHNHFVGFPDGFQSFSDDSLLSLGISIQTVDEKFFRVFDFQVVHIDDLSDKFMVTDMS